MSEKNSDKQSSRPKRSATETELARIKRQNELLLEAAGEGIYGINSEGNTTFVNPAAAQMLGYAADELIGQPMHALLHHTRPDGSKFPKEQCPIYAAFKDGAVHHVDDEVFWAKDGSSIPVEYTSTPIRENNKLSGAVVVFKDITERKQAEQALRQDSGWPDARGSRAQGEFRHRRKRRSPGGSGTGEGIGLDCECGKRHDLGVMAGRRFLRYPWMVR
ncbi:MAG: PAS domain S-box protein [Thiogranum sp.]